MVSIAVVIPTIPSRRKKLEQLLHQIDHQQRRPDEVIVWNDGLGQGAAIARNHAMAEATSDFVAFFDDDDEMYPRHLEHLERTQAQTGADLVYPWHDLLPPAPNPLKVCGMSPFGRPFDIAARRQIIEGINFIPIAVLVRRSAMEAIGGFCDFGLQEWDAEKCEVLDAWRRLLQARFTFVHCPKKTWAAVRNGKNTAGLRWQDHTGTKQRGYDR